MDPISPLDIRYGDDEIKAIFTENGRLQRLLDVEAALARAHATVGNVPKEAAEEITNKASTEFVSADRVREIEAEIRHDLMAVVHALAEQCDDDHGEWVHLGATSYDIIDCANALGMRQANAILRQGLERLEQALAQLSRDHKDTPCLGRTHGQHAVPTTFGYKMAAFLLETWRHRQRLEEMEDRCMVGKMMGAVGSGAGLGEKAFEIEAAVASELGIPMEEAPTQIVARDRYSEVYAELANLVTSLERFATEIRNLQRNELNEAAEGFNRAKQVGSSTMAQKKNPVVCERVCGLARTCRTLLTAGFENQVQWHERDLANSSSERFLIPYMFTLAHACVEGMADVFEGLVVNEDQMKENLHGSPGVTAEAAVMFLAKNGIGRQTGHELVRQASVDAKTLDEVIEGLMALDEVKAITSKEELAKVMDPLTYVGVAPELTQRVLRVTGYE